MIASVAHNNFTTRKFHIFDSQTHHFHQTQARAIQQPAINLYVTVILVNTTGRRFGTRA